MSYRLHSSTSLSLAVWGQLTAQWQHLALCFSFVKIWLHWITITTSTSCLLRSRPSPHSPLPTPFSPILPLPILCPQPDPSSWILSEWHPLNLANYLSSGHAALGCTFFSQGGATGPKALQLDFLTTHQKRHTLRDTLNPSLSSSKARATGHTQIIWFQIIMQWGKKSVPKQGLDSFWPSPSYIQVPCLFLSTHVPGNHTSGDSKCTNSCNY